MGIVNIYYFVLVLVLATTDTILTAFNEGLSIEGFSLFTIMHITNFGLIAYGLVYLFQKKRDQERAAREKVESIRQRQEEAQNALFFVLENLPGGVNVVSPQFVIQKVNDEIVKFSELSRDEAIGKKCFDVFGDGNVCPDCPVSKALKTGQVHKNIKRNLSRQNEEFYFERTAIPILKPGGGVKNVIEIVLDVTKEVKLEQERKTTFVQTVTALSALIDSRDTSTGVHSARVRDIAIDIGRELSLSPEILEEISIAAILHDIGKISTPEAILNKPGSLTEIEFATIKEHPKIGYETLKNIPFLTKIAEYILYHHERYDGSGYPYGISGKDIPLVSRILSVADVFEAITADRVYRKAMPLHQALIFMYQGMGTLFDSRVLEAFFEVLQRKQEDARTILTAIRIKRIKKEQANIG
jgi:putative nucleotidyltransferase with HDIG domain/PAS domain S-box-containing protein